MTLYINGCVREKSRTNELAQEVFAHCGTIVQEVNLNTAGIMPLNRQTLAHRDECLAHNQFDDDIFKYAHQFAAADTIVIAAPYWDLLFPANIRTYLEHICVCGVTFRYGENGIPQSLCQAKRLIYVTTAGGPIFEPHLGYEYVKTLAATFFGIRDVRMFKAENLDIIGADVDAIMQNAKNEIKMGNTDL
ncbi:MAG: NAD(P)H-dependent oxidoreductase [Spirochaetales bacterium]|nr:NAD(P)H-dependent oxidoreductase [Spirochaetales bacterium]